MSLSGIKLITFDATNTLLKFRIPPWNYYTLVARNYGFTGSETDVKVKFIDSYKSMWDRFPNYGKQRISWTEWWQKVIQKTFAGQVPEDTTVAISKILIEEYKSSKLWCVAEGGSQLLSLLHKKGILLGVLSNFDPRLHDILRNLDLKKQFKFIITSYEAGCSKPDEKIFIQAMKKCEISKPSECLHIGDDVKKDYEAAISAGWRALIVPPKDNPIMVQADKPPPKEHVYPSLYALAVAIERDEVKF